MKISVVIVNYKVKFFLEQCLHSLYKAGANTEMEVFVVDNNSGDDSVEYLRKRFPKVIFIENTKNVGFAKANNQAIRKSKGELILLLNPDTFLGESTLDEVISFMDSNPNTGAVGVKMIDATGRFLPESKRSIPTPWVSFCKVFGLSILFPNSKIFGRYSLGYLDKNSVHKIDILAGAFMLFRKDVLDEIGLLDESFFMYGEDIDISYRVIKKGYDNYYLPTSIIHYKGESTPKHSIKYVRIFYEAMDIFFKKHNSNTSFAYSLFIRFAILFRATIAGSYRLANRMTGNINKKGKRLCNVLVISSPAQNIRINDIIRDSSVAYSSVKNICEKVDIDIISEQIITENLSDIILSDSVFSNDEIIKIIENLDKRGVVFSIHIADTDTIVSPGQKFSNNISIC